MKFEKLQGKLKKEIIGYAAIIFLVAIADKLYWQTDQILLGIFESANDIAIYAVAIQFIMIFLSLSVAINNVFLPKITKLVQEKNYKTELNELYLKVSEIQTFIIGLAFSGFIIFGDLFINLWIGEEYKLAYIITIILMSTFFFDLIQNLGIIIMQARGKYHFRAYSLIICSFLNIIISIPIINNYGSIGTAIITSLFVLIGNVIILNIYFHFKLGLNMKYYWLKIYKFLLIIALSTLISFYGFGFYNLNSWLEFFVAIFIYLVFYCLIIYLFYIDKTRKKIILIKLKLIKIS